MIACDEFEWFVERRTHAATIGKADAIIKDSASISFTNESINAVVEGGGGYVWNGALLLVSAFKTLSALNGIK